MDGPRQNILQFDPDRRKEELPELEQFVRGVLSTLKELAGKNEELKRAGVELQTSLKQSRQKSQEQDDRIVNLEAALKLANEKTQELKERNSDLMVAFKLANEKNHEMDEANAQLLAALQHANERAGQLERWAEAEERRYRTTLESASEMLARAADEMEALAKVEEEHDRDRWVGMKRQSVELRAHASHLMSPPIGVVPPDNGEASEVAEATEDAAEAETPLPVEPQAEAIAKNEPLDEVKNGDADNAQARLVELLKTGLAEIANPEAMADTRDPGAPVNLEDEPEVDETINKLQDQLYRLMQRLSPDQEQESEAAVETVEESHPKVVSIGPATEQVEPAEVEPETESVAQSHTDSIELVASPFESYSSLAEFHKAIKQLPGVVDVIAHGLEGGTLRLEVVYAGSGPLADLLMELSRFDLRLVSVGDRKIEVRVIDTSGES